SFTCADEAYSILPLRLNFAENILLISNNPTGVRIILFLVARLTVDSCISISSAISFIVIGFKCVNPYFKNSGCFLMIVLTIFIIVTLLCSMLFIIQT